MRIGNANDRQVLTALLLLAFEITPSLSAWSIALATASTADSTYKGRLQEKIWRTVKSAKKTSCTRQERMEEQNFIPQNKWKIKTTHLIKYQKYMSNGEISWNRKVVDKKKRWLLPLFCQFRELNIPLLLRGSYVECVVAEIVQRQTIHH